jgi:hypothetical protein
MRRPIVVRASKISENNYKESLSGNLTPFGGVVSGVTEPDFYVTDFGRFAPAVGSVERWKGIGHSPDHKRYSWWR